MPGINLACIPINRNTGNSFKSLFAYKTHPKLVVIFFFGLVIFGGVIYLLLREGWTWRTWFATLLVGLQSPSGVKHFIPGCFVQVTKCISVQHTPRPTTISIADVNVMKMEAHKKFKPSESTLLLLCFLLLLPTVELKR